MALNPSFASLRKLRSALAALRAIDPDLTVLQAAALIEIATAKELTGTQLAETLGVPQSTTTRAVDVLGSHGRGGRKGLGLVRRDAAPDDRRVKILKLNARGERALAGLAAGID